MLDSALLDAADLEAARALLLDGADAERLYSAWFHFESGELYTWPEPGAYRNAAINPQRFEGGWHVEAAADGVAGNVVIARGEERRTAAPPWITPASLLEIALRPGAAVLADPLTGDAQRGFWHLWSAGWRAAPPAALQRIYVPLTPANSLQFVRKIADGAEAQVPWAAKVLTGAHDAGRRDAGVIYLEVELSLETDAARTLLSVATPLADGPLPRFVKPLAQGLGWARDPGGNQSFGQAVTSALVALRSDAGDAATFRNSAAQAVAHLIGVPQ